MGGWDSELSEDTRPATPALAALAAADAPAGAAGRAPRARARGASCCARPTRSSRRAFSPRSRSRTWCTRAPRSSTPCCARPGVRTAPRTTAGRWSPSAATAAANCIPAPTSTSCCWCRSRPTSAGGAAVERLITFLWDIGLEVGHSVRTVERMRRGKRGGRERHDDAARSAAARRRCGALGGDARRARPRAHLAGEAVLRGQGARAGRAAPEGQRHRLQPRAQRQDRSGRPARHPDHRLGGQAPLRRRLARWRWRPTAS